MDNKLCRMHELLKRIEYLHHFLYENKKIVLNNQYPFLNK